MLVLPTDEAAPPLENPESLGTGAVNYYLAMANSSSLMGVVTISLWSFSY